MLAGVVSGFVPCADLGLLHGVTALPLSLGVVAVASWVGITGTESLAWVKRLLPGGSATELVVNAWNGGVELTDGLLLLGPIVGWVVVAIALASRLFR